MGAYNTEKMYWLKMPRDFFKRHDMRILESLPNGKEYELFYLKLLVESIDHGGELRFNELIPYDGNMLSVITNTPIDTVTSACTALVQLGLIEVMDDKTLYMTKLEDMVGSSTRGALAKKEQRGKKLMPPAETADGGQMSSKCLGDIDKEIDKDKEIESNKRFKKPTLSEVSAYISEKSYIVDAQAFMDYYDSNGWKVGKNSMKDWKAAVRMWNTREIKNVPYTSRPTVKKKVSNCPSCGNKLRKDQQTGKYFCTTCWNTYKPSEVEVQ